MSNLIVTYDPIHGQTVPDGSAEKWVHDNIIRPTIHSDQETDGSFQVTVGSFLLIDLVRLAVKNRKLWEPVQFAFKDVDNNNWEIPVQLDGRLAIWPAGFCNVYDTVLDNLLDF